MILVVDTELGNVKSVYNMLKKIGIKACISSQHADVNQATKIILPGVGSFDAGMQQLNKNNLKEILSKKVLLEKTPILGICLGMQLFACGSEEGVSEGLGWINGYVKKFNFSSDHNGLKVPNMGWRSIGLKSDTPLLRGFVTDPRFYFVHSYYFSPIDPTLDTLTANYGHSFCAGFKKDNIYGVQFHPEKSHQYGMVLLKNFVMQG